MPLAAARAMRTPVNDPGPRPTHTHASCPRTAPASANSASTRGMSWVLDARRASTSAVATGATERPAASSRPSPMAMTSLAVSKASTSGDAMGSMERFPFLICVESCLHSTSWAPAAREARQRRALRGRQSWVLPSRAFESLAHTHRSWREREP